MYLLGIGLILMFLKYQAIDPVATWSWLTVLIPFGLAMAWWAWADASGYTKRKAMQKEEKRKKTRLEKQRESLGFKKKRR
jgi:small Trp-rich protein